MTTLITLWSAGRAWLQCWGRASRCGRCGGGVEGWQSLAAVLGQGLKVWEVWRIRTRRSLAASIQGQSKLQPLAHVQSKLQPLAPVVKHSDPPSLPPRLQPIRLFQLLLPPSPPSPPPAARSFPASPQADLTRHQRTEQHPQAIPAATQTVQQADVTQVGGRKGLRLSRLKP